MSLFTGTIPCSVCMKTNGRIICSFDNPDPFEKLVGVTADNYWRHWLACEGCSLLRSEFSRDSEVLHTIYEEKYRSVGSGLRQHTVEELFLKISNIPKQESETHFRVDWLLNSLEILKKSRLISDKLSSRLLDVGGASGVFAHAMMNHGFEADVLDPSQDGDFIRKYGVGYYQGYFGQTPLEKQYDIMSFLYVLEHLAEPGAMLDIAKRNLSPDGLVFFELPDATVVDFGNSEHDAYNACHLWLFGSAQITELLTKHGFSVLALQRYITVRGYPSMMVLAGHSDRFDSYQKSTNNV